MTKEELFHLIKATTTRAQSVDALGYAKRRDEAKHETLVDYGMKANGRLDMDQDDGGKLMQGVSSASWFPIRAALLVTAGVHYRNERRSCDEAQRSGDYEQAAIHATRAARAITAIERVMAAEKPATTGRRKTKRRSLPSDPDWRASVWREATSRQRPAIAVLWASGCRPSEIEKGVTVKRVTAGIVLTISGSKVSDVSGQQQREILIDEASAEGQALQEALGTATKIEVIRPAKRLNKDMAAIREKIGVRAISPYSLRHQRCADLKATLDPENVAVAMGHAVTRSQSRYGSVRQAQASGVKGAKATRPVKDTASRLTKPTDLPSRGPVP